MTILTPDKFKLMFPQTSIHIDSERVQHYIEESEYQYVKEKITDSLYIDLLKYLNSGNNQTFPSEYQTLLEGGIFETTTHCNNTELRIFKGLYAAIGYYVYSKMLRRNSENLTRFGFANKNDEYSANIEYKIKLSDERESLRIADIYINDCISYIASKKDIFTKFGKNSKFKNRLKITVIK